MSEITDERLTEIENAALKGLLDLVYAAWCLADDSEDLGDGYHKVDHANMVKLCEALDALDELPDDQPGYTMAEAAKAKWALRRLLAAQERRASSPAAGRDAVIEEWRPIESAPKDGSNILIIAGNAYSPEARQGWWGGDAWLFWSRAEKFALGGIGPMVEVTHWMPLPAPPVSLKETPNGN